MRVFLGFVGILLALLTLTYAGMMDGTRWMDKDKDGDNITKKFGLCPRPTTLKGNCTFDSRRNCIEHDECPTKQKCCREGCNKICKVFIPIPKDVTSIPDFGILNKWKSEKMKEWDAWAQETKQIMMERLAGLWQIAAPAPVE